MTASSTSAPMAMAIPPSVIVLIVMPRPFSAKIATTSDSGDSEHGDEGRAGTPEEGEEDEHDEDRAVAQRLHDVVDRRLDEVGLAEDATMNRHSRRECALHLL